MIVAVDGPAGAGKSTAARLLAKHLGFAYLDSGAMYRAVALKALEQGIDLGDAGAVGELARSMDLELRACGGGEAPRVLLDGRDVSARIREPDISRASSEIATLAEVRNELVARQRWILARGDHVAEGRDIGTVVAPGAELKLFLTASRDERARRRAKDLGLKGEGVEQGPVADELKERDRADMTRDVSPLEPAADAVQIDTTDLSVDEVVERIVALIAERRW